MIEDLKPYPQYKDSGLAWLGKVPAHWGIARSKRLFRQRKEFAQSDDQQLSATQAFGVIPQALYEQRTGYRVVKISMHLNKRKHVQADDFVISMRSFQGGLERAWAAGAIRSSYVVLEPGAEVSAGYFQHLFKSHQYINALRATSDFIRDGQDLNFGNFCGVDLPLIPLQEQAAIARFLAWATNRLDSTIGAKRRIIALLQEQKQAIIQRAVTRGLDPSVPLKDSGIPWLGEIPEHWEIANLGRLCIARCDGPFGSGLKSSHYTDAGVRVIRLQNIGIGEFKDGDRAYIAPEHYDSLGDHDVVAGDLLVAGLGDERVPAGRSCLAPPNCEPAMVKADCFRFRMKKNHNIPQFVAIQLSATAHAATSCLSTGATRLRINLSASSARSVALPPGLEQQAILHHMEKKTSPLSSAISRLESEITLLREYRTRLIADVVTGKLDVREAAAGLPEDVEPPIQSDAAAYDGDEAEDDSDSDPIDTEED
jgi:type I restriction enzyme S subunit